MPFRILGERPCLATGGRSPTVNLNTLGDDPQAMLTAKKNNPNRTRGPKVASRPRVMHEVSLQVMSLIIGIDRRRVLCKGSPAETHLPGRARMSGGLMLTRVACSLV